MPEILRPARRLAAVLCFLLAFGGFAHADEDAAPNCPLGVIKCPKRPIDWSMCKKSDLLDFFVEGLPSEGDRSAVDAHADANKVSSSDSKHYLFEGDAALSRLDQLLRADTIVYDAETTDYDVIGHVRYQDRGILMSADHGKGNADLGMCTMDEVRYQILTSRGNGVAATAIMQDKAHAHLTDSTYSTCDLSNQVWSFHANDLVLDQDEGIGKGHDVTFRVHDVPVFWLPYATFPLDDRRESGFLYPSFGYSSRRGFDFTLPYYFNLAPNYDATLLPRLMTDRGLMLGGEFRYLIDSSSGTLNFEALPNDRKVPDENFIDDDTIPNDRWWYKWMDTTGITSNWSASINLNRVSDDRYFEDFGRGLYNSAISFLPSSAYLNGHGDWWNASIGGDVYQITDPTIAQQYEPYHRLPRMTFNGEQAFLGDLTWGVNSEFIAFSKDHAIEGQRFDAFPYLAFPVETAAYFFRPQLGYRYTAYSLSDLQYSTTPLTDKNPTRGVPIFSIDSGLIFERSLSIGDASWTQTLEPRVYYLRVPYRNQNDIPIFDTQEIPFSFGELFRTNRFVGADRQMDANNLSLAVTTRLLEDATGDERLSASIGEIRYFDDQRVQIPGVPPTDFGGSTYAGELDLRLSDRWRVTLDQQWNPNTERTDLSAVTLQDRFGSDGGIFNLSYRYRRDFLEQVDASALVPITPAWSVIARWNYALNNPLALPTDPHGTAGRTLERFVGVEHDSCCIAFRVLARHWVHDVQGDVDNAVYFEIEFKGVGSLGQKTDNFLRRSILGYQ